MTISDVIKTLLIIQFYRGSASKPIQQGAMLTKGNKMTLMMAFEIQKALLLSLYGNVASHIQLG